MAQCFCAKPTGVYRDHCHKRSNRSETALPADSTPASSAVASRTHVVQCSSSRRELWLLAIVFITGVLMAAVVLLPAVLS